MAAPEVVFRDTGAGYWALTTVPGGATISMGAKAPWFRGMSNPMVSRTAAKQVPKVAWYGRLMPVRACGSLPVKSKTRRSPCLFRVSCIFQVSSPWMSAVSLQEPSANSRIRSRSTDSV